MHQRKPYKKLCVFISLQSLAFWPLTQAFYLLKKVHWHMRPGIQSYLKPFEVFVNTQWRDLEYHIIREQCKAGVEWSATKGGGQGSITRHPSSMAADEGATVRLSCQHRGELGICHPHPAPLVHTYKSTPTLVSLTTSHGSCSGMGAQVAAYVSVFPLRQLRGRDWSSLCVLTSVFSIYLQSQKSLLKLLDMLSVCVQN